MRRQTCEAAHWCNRSTFHEISMVNFASRDKQQLGRDSPGRRYGSMGSTTKTKSNVARDSSPARPHSLRGCEIHSVGKKGCTGSQG